MATSDIMSLLPEWFMLVDCHVRKSIGVTRSFRIGIDMEASDTGRQRTDRSY